jgi:hypothetical protein
MERTNSLQLPCHDIREKCLILDGWSVLPEWEAGSSLRFEKVLGAAFTAEKQEPSRPTERLRL